MKQRDAEDMYIRSLDDQLDEQEKSFLNEALRNDPGLANELNAHIALREKLRAKESSSFGPFFASRVVSAIQNSGIVLDHYFLSLFRRFQLAAVGLTIGLLALNVILSEQFDVMSILGIEVNASEEEDAYVFDFFESLNDNI